MHPKITTKNHKESLIFSSTTYYRRQKNSPSSVATVEELDNEFLKIDELVKSEGYKLKKEKEKKMKAKG